MSKKLLKLSKRQRQDLITIGVSALLLGVGIATESTFVLILALIISGWETIFSAIRSILKGQLMDENFLMSLAACGAIYCNEFHEAIGVMLFYRVGQFFEHYAVNSSRQSIAALMDIAPDTAILIEDGEEKEVFPEEVAVGSTILVRPGDKVPIDGIVIEGISALNTAALTGESLPVDVEPGSSIVSGSININGILKVKTTCPYEDSTVAKVLDMVENSATRKASVEKFITKFAHYYTPVVVVLAVILALAVPLLWGLSFKSWIYVAAKFLVISCPCALVISVPLSLFSGIGACSKEGILVKGGNYLEALSAVNTIAFDKTGTLTCGTFSVTEVEVAQGLSEEDFLLAAWICEKNSSHPIAKSISAYVENKLGKAYLEERYSKSQVTNSTESCGKGISLHWNNQRLLCGNHKLMLENYIEFQEPSALGSVVFLAIDGKAAGYLIISDTVRTDSKETITALKKLGIKKTAMITGDRAQVAQSIAKQLSIDYVESQLLPDQKVEVAGKLLQEAHSHHKMLAFVGDGINDAPVLAGADVGIAMGALGSDAAIEAADLVIMTDQLSKLVAAVKISKKTLRICKENIVFALFVKIMVMILAPFGLISMWGAVFADVGVAIIAILNAMRALTVKNS